MAKKNAPTQVSVPLPGRKRKTSFTSATAGKRGRGRPRGSRNKATIERQEWLEWIKDFFDSERYRESAERRILAGEAKHLEILGLYYVKGKPRERISIETRSESPTLQAARAMPKEQLQALYELALKVQEIERGRAIDVKAIPMTASPSAPAGGADGR